MSADGKTSDPGIFLNDTSRDDYNRSQLKGGDAIGAVCLSAQVYQEGHMVTEAVTNDIESIGNVAGVIWHYLQQNGAVTMSKLAKDVDAPRDLVMQGVGWLAREGKVRFEETPRSKLITLV